MLFSVVKKRDAITDCERNDRASLKTRPHVPMYVFTVTPNLRDQSNHLKHRFAVRPAPFCTSLTGHGWMVLLLRTDVSDFSSL